MDADSLRERIRKLPKGKAPGMDGIPYEYFIYGPPNLHDYVLAAANAFMSGSHPLPTDWLGGHVTLLPKTEDAQTMRQFRPITNLSTSYKLCAVEVTDRLDRACEEFGVRHGSQEGARRGRNTRRQIFRLIKTIEGGKRRQEVVVILQLDFVAAFTSARQQALRKTHEAYGMPPAEIGRAHV